jgi:hypothetical protein
MASQQVPGGAQRLKDGRFFTSIPPRGVEVLVDKEYLHF